MPNSPTNSDTRPAICELLAEMVPHLRHVNGVAKLLPPGPAHEALERYSQAAWGRASRCSGSGEESSMSRAGSTYPPREPYSRTATVAF